MARKFDILGLGVAVVDELLLVRKFPLPNEKFPVLSWERQSGGLTATALVAASRLGCDCHLPIPLGADDLSGFIRNALTREGITLHERPGKPGERPYNAIVITEKGSGDRTIIWSEEGLFSLELGPADLELVDQAGCVFVDNGYADNVVGAARRARDRGIPVVGDFESTAPNVVELINLTDHAIMPLAHASSLTGESDPVKIVAAMMRTPGRTLACVTDSERGSWHAERGDPERVLHQPAFQVETIVDTCGCGDVFHGAYAACLVRGFPPAERIRRASAAAALKAGKAGSQLGAPTLAELEAFLKGRG